MDSPWPPWQNICIVFFFWLLCFPQKLGLKCKFRGFLRLLVNDLLMFSPLDLHCMLARNHDFAAQSPIYFAACSHPTKILVRTIHIKIMMRQQQLNIYLCWIQQHLLVKPLKRPLKKKSEHKTVEILDWGIIYCENTIICEYINVKNIIPCFSCLDFKI